MHLSQYAKTLITLALPITLCLAAVPAGADPCFSFLQTGHLLGNVFRGLPESELMGRVSVFGASPAIDNGSALFLCGSVGQMTAAGICPAEAGTPDDGVVMVEGDWSAPGVSGCPPAANRGDSPNVAFTTSIVGEGTRYQEDSDGDGRGDACDPCPFDPLPVVDCSQRVTSACISFSSDLGKGSGTVSWRTQYETDVVGFNVVTIDPKGNRTQLNLAQIRCEECITGQGHVYTFIVPKHKGGHDIFIEMLRINGAIQVFGPAVKDCVP